MVILPGMGHDHYFVWFGRPLSRQGLFWYQYNTYNNPEVDRICFFWFNRYFNFVISDSIYSRMTVPILTYIYIYIHLHMYMIIYIYIHTTFDYTWIQLVKLFLCALHSRNYWYAWYFFRTCFPDGDLRFSGCRPFPIYPPVLKRYGNWSIDGCFTKHGYFQ